LNTKIREDEDTPNLNQSFKSHFVQMFSPTSLNKSQSFNHSFNSDSITQETRNLSNVDKSSVINTNSTTSTTPNNQLNKSSNPFATIVNKSNSKWAQFLEEEENESSENEDNNGISFKDSRYEIVKEEKWD